MLMSSRPIATTRGRSGGSASKTVARPSGSRAVVTRPLRLVEQKEARALGRRERFAVDAHVVGVAHVEGGALEHLAVDADTSLDDPCLGFAARANARPRHDLGDALAGTDF